MIPSYRPGRVAETKEYSCPTEAKSLIHSGFVFKVDAFDELIVGARWRGLGIGKVWFARFPVWFRMSALVSATSR